MSRRPKFYFAAIALLLIFGACGNGDDQEPEADSVTETGGDTGEVVTTDSGLQYEDLQVGDGEEAEPGKVVTVHYVGSFENGKVFESSVKQGQPFPFLLGARLVIPGWEEGIEGMRVGGKRRLTIPPDLAYGEAGRPGIPPNSTLVFEVELLKVEEPPQ